MAGTAPPGDDPLVGMRVGSYVVEERLGSGAMGAVYRGVQPQIGKRVALKFLAEELAHDPDVVARFFEEARAVNVIGHENIVDIYDFGRTAEGRNYFVMELLDGRSLDRVLAEERALAPARAVDVARQIARALGAAHGRGIVHRDLKPENVFLTTLRGRPDFVKIVDFGIAKLTGRDGKARTAAGTILGTPGYMAPEQATGGTVDHRVDVYALGVVTYATLAGRTPFPGKNLGEILQQQLLEVAPRLERFRADVPPALGDLVAAMLAREPSLRPPAMEAVEAALASIAAARPSTGVAFATGPAPRPPTLESSLPTTITGPQSPVSPVLPKRSFIPFLLALLVGVAVGMGVLFWLWGGL